MLPFLILFLFSPEMLKVKPSPVFADVSIGANGPYRFLVDTGAQTSLIDVKLAAELNLRPRFRVEVVSQNGSRLSPALRLNTLHIGPMQLPDSEVVFDDLAEARRLDPSIRGALGLNALAGVDFTLFPRAHRIEFGAGRPDGEAIPLRRVDERIAVEARMGLETLTLILDSGANHVVLFRLPQAMAKTPPVPTTLSTIDGIRKAVPTCWTADMLFSHNLRIGTLPAAIVSASNTPADGLLPASVFTAVHVAQTLGEVVLVH